jgi:prophage regulatory protein
MSTSALLRTTDVCTLLQISQPTLFRWLKENQLPQPLKLGPRLNAWKPEVMEAWLAERQAAARDIAR